MVGVLLLLVGCQSGKKETVAPKPLPPKVKVHTIAKEAYPIWLHFTGRSEAVDAADVISRVTGNLQKIHFKPGQKVMKGEVLFTIDDKDYRDSYEQARAMLKRDRAAYRLAKTKLDRYLPLAKEELVPRQTIDELNASVRQMAAVLAADRAAVQRARLSLSYCQIEAPIDGFVGQPTMLSGNLVRAGDKLTRIVQGDRLYIHFYPSAEEAATIQKYARSPYPKVRVYLPGQKRLGVLEGRVDFIDTMAKSATDTVAMRAEAANPKRLVLPGAFVGVDLFLGDYDVIALHPDQVLQDPGGRYAYVVETNATLHKRYITPLFSNNDLVIVKEGLKPGDRVVTDVTAGLAEGLVVEPVEVANPIHVER